MQTAYSPLAFCRSKITSVQASSLPSALAIATTDDVQYYDVRQPRMPLFTWAHHRGYDRTLALSALSVHDTDAEALVLSSQCNRLLCVYGARKGRFYAPHELPSAVPVGVSPTSPTPPFLGRLGTRTALVEQTDRGALWLQYVGSHKDDEQFHPPMPRWTSQACRNDLLAKQVEDAGPFGEHEVTHIDLRAVYRGAYHELTDVSGHARPARARRLSRITGTRGKGCIAGRA